LTGGRRNHQISAKIRADEEGCGTGRLRKRNVEKDSDESLKKIPRAKQRAIATAAVSPAEATIPDSSPKDESATDSALGKKAGAKPEAVKPGVDGAAKALFGDGTIRVAHSPFNKQFKTSYNVTEKDIKDIQTALDKLWAAEKATKKPAVISDITDPPNRPTEGGMAEDDAAVRWLGALRRRRPKAELLDVDGVVGVRLELVVHPDRQVKIVGANLVRVEALDKDVPFSRVRIEAVAVLRLFMDMPVWMRELEHHLISLAAGVFCQRYVGVERHGLAPFRLIWFQLKLDMKRHVRPLPFDEHQHRSVAWR
jgi:hypothetical protein